MKQLTDYETILEVCRRSNISYVPGDCVIKAAGAEFKFSPTGQLLDADQDENLIEQLRDEVQELKADLRDERDERQSAEQALRDYKKKVAEVLGSIKGLQSLSKPGSPGFPLSPGRGSSRRF